MSLPRRIVCHTEETTETLNFLGEDEWVFEISRYTGRPPVARAKPKVSTFVNARFEKISALELDLVFAFSDMQADVVAELIRRGVSDFAFNQRSLREILEMALTVAIIVGAEAKGRELVERLEGEIEAIVRPAARFPRRPRLFFEEWNDPLISGIQ